MALFRCASGSSGGSGYSSGEGVTSHAGEEVTIHTGLSSISEFYLVYNLVCYDDSNLMATLYRSDRTYKQTAVWVYASSYNFLKWNSFATSDGNCVVITGINGGDVSIKTGNGSATWGSVEYYWTAKA